MSSRQVKRTVPGAVRQTVRRTVCRLVAVSSEDRLKDQSAGPCHKCLSFSKSRSILLIPDVHRVDGQSACLFNHLLSTILEPMEDNLANGPSENSISGSELLKEAAPSRCVAEVGSDCEKYPHSTLCHSQEQKYPVTHFGQNVPENRRLLVIG